MKKPEIILRLLRIPLDYVSVLAAFLLAYEWRSNPELIPWVGLREPDLLPFSDFLTFSLQAAALVVLLFAWERLYGLRKSYALSKEFRRIALLTGAAFTIIILYFFLFGIQFFSRFILGAAFVFSLLFMIAGRLILKAIQRWLWRKGVGRRRVLLIGEGAVLKELAAYFRTLLGFEMVGQLQKEQKLSDLIEMIQKHEVDEVVQGGMMSYSADIVEFCQLNHIEYRFVPSLLEVQRTNMEIDFFHNIPLITLRSSAIDWWGRVVKRAMDVVGASTSLIVLSPLLVLIAVGIKFDDGGPIFYKSRRISRNKKFWMWKFRTMVVDADKKKQELLEQNRRSGPLFKIQNDPRITRFGRFLRRTSLDELPQLWNVFKGDLSLVGPRAHLPEEVAQYEKHHRKVLAVKAGVTGLAQISGRSKLDFEKEVKLDVYYLENWSIRLDTKIILKTFGVLLEGE